MYMGGLYGVTDDWQSTRCDLLDSLNLRRSGTMRYDDGYHNDSGRCAAVAILARNKPRRR